MVLVERFRVVLASVEPGQEELCQAHHGLRPDKDIRDEAQYGVRRLEVLPAVADLVVLDDDQPCDGGEGCDIVERGVDVGALFLLLRGVGRLEDEDALDEEEDGGGVQELFGLLETGRC